MPAVDIYTNDKRELVLKASCPTSNQEDIELTTDDNTLTLRGERKFDTDVMKDEFHRIERSCGSFTRMFVLPPAVDAGNWLLRAAASTLSTYKTLSSRRAMSPPLTVTAARHRVARGLHAIYFGLPNSAKLIHKTIEKSARSRSLDGALNLRVLGSIPRRLTTQSDCFYPFIFPIVWSAVSTMSPRPGKPIENAYLESFSGKFAMNA